MSALALLLQAEAASQQRAVRSTAYRHTYLDPKPFVVCAYNLSGEAAAPLALAYGTGKKPEIVVAAEPRNRDSRFGAINEFCADLVGYIEPFLATETIRLRNGHQLETAVEAPQIVVPNHATRNYLGERLGRSLRYLGLGETHPVPDATAWAGSHLSWLAEHAHYPGQSMLVAATDLLREHFATGQSALEDESLATLLAWIDNPPNAGFAAIRAAEQRPSFGPVPTPEWEAELEPHVRAYGHALRADDVAGMAKAERAVRKLVTPALVDGYDSTRRAIDILRAIPAAAGVAERHEADIREWGSHCRRAQRGIPRFRRRHDALQAARMLERWSKALDDLEFRRVIDDPMLMAELEVAGQCATGTVVARDMDHREVKAGNTNATQVPLITLRLGGSTRLLRGMSALWADDARVSAEIRDVTATGKGTTVALAIMSGHNRGTRVPAADSRTTFVALSHFGGLAPAQPDEVPWTHRPDVSFESDAVLDDDRRYLKADETDGGADGSPDLDPSTLAGLPQVGLVAPADVPGAVL